MARKLVVVWLVLLTVGVWARPVEILLRPPHDPSLCPGCDCPKYDCFTPGCDCTLPITQPWCETMLGRIRQRLVGALGQRLEVPIRLRIKLVDPTRMLAFGAGDGVEGVYADECITLSSMLSRRQAIVALAHEYGHAWQSVFHPGYDEVDGALREGWAEWVALQALKRFGEATGGDALRSNRDPVYGGGLRWFLQVEKNFGVEAVFEQATTWIDTRGTRLAPTPKKPEMKLDDPNLPDDMPEPGSGDSTRQATPGEATGSLRQPGASGDQPLLVGRSDSARL